MMMRKPGRDLPDESPTETGRKSPGDEEVRLRLGLADGGIRQYRKEQRRDLKRRAKLDLTQRNEQRLAGPETRPEAWIVRARWRGLRPATPNGPTVSQALPFVVPEPAREIWFDDPLPEYVDWKTFAYPDGPGPEFAHWLSQRVPSDADVVPVVAPDHDPNDWRSYGSYQPFGAPLIAERARPSLPRKRALLRMRLEERMPPLVARKPGRQAPREGIPRWEMNAAFVHDIYGVSTLEIAQAVDHGDYRNANRREWKDGEANSHSGRTYVREGRACLSRLGAWPWCLRKDGHLDGRWFEKAEYARALALWHYQQQLAAFTATFSPMAGAARNPTASRLADVNAEWSKEMARAAYREAYECRA